MMSGVQGWEDVMTALVVTVPEASGGFRAEAGADARRVALVADGQELFSRALGELLQRELGYAEVVVVTGFEAATRNLSRNPAISFAVLDVTMSDMDGLASLASLRVAYPDLRLAAIATSKHREDILRALSVGVHGYLPRTLAISDMVHAMRTIAGGQIYVPPTLSDVFDEPLADSPLASAAARMVEHGRDGHDMTITSRQRQVMQLIAEGKTNKQIAGALGLAEGTVKAHVNALFRALSVHNRASVAAALVARRELGDEVVFRERQDERYRPH